PAWLQLWPIGGMRPAAPDGRAGRGGTADAVPAVGPAASPWPTASPARPAEQSGGGTHHSNSDSHHSNSDSHHSNSDSNADDYYPDPKPDAYGSRGARPGVSRLPAEEPERAWRRELDPHHVLPVGQVHRPDARAGEEILQLMHERGHLPRLAGRVAGRRAVGGTQRDARAGPSGAGAERHDGQRPL